MGPGDALFTRFGHAALCVDGTCWNYGTADFSDPVRLGWQVLRGRAMFWVATSKQDEMIELYQSRGRSVFVQELSLPEEAAEEIRDHLVDVLFSDEKYFVYHHFRDNCTTRVRDVLSRATKGKLGPDRGPPSELVNALLHNVPGVTPVTGRRIPDGPSLREMVRSGFAGDVGLLLVGELILGRAGDRPTTRWQAMFLPSVLREVVATRLGAVPRQVAPGPLVPPGPRWLGTAVLWGVAVFLAGWLLLLRRWPRLAFGLVGLVLGLLGLALWALAVVSVSGELRWNEHVLLFWPTDLALLFLGRRRRASYLGVRMAVLLLVVVGHLSTLLVQPLGPLALALLPIGVGWWLAGSAALDDWFTAWSTAQQQSGSGRSA